MIDVNPALSVGFASIVVVDQATAARSTHATAYVLETGEIAMEGDAKELAKSDEVRKAYLGVG